MSRKPRYAALYLLAGLRIRIRRIRMFLDLLEPDPDSHIRILLIKQKSQTNLDFYCFVTFFYALSLKNDVNVPSKSNKQKMFCLKLVFFGVLKVNDENGRPDPDPLVRGMVDPRIRIHTKMSLIRMDLHGLLV
jgi:hypothetical protein